MLAIRRAILIALSQRKGISSMLHCLCLAVLDAKSRLQDRQIGSQRKVTNTSRHKGEDLGPEFRTMLSVRRSIEKEHSYPEFRLAIVVRQVETTSHDIFRGDKLWVPAYSGFGGSIDTTRVFRVYLLSSKSRSRHSDSKSKCAYRFQTFCNATIVHRLMNAAEGGNLRDFS